MIGVAFAVLAIAVYVATAIALVRAVKLARGLQARARRLQPQDLLVKAQGVPGEVRRIAAAVQALGPLLKRGTIALASLARSIALFRAQCAAVRQAFL